MRTRRLVSAERNVLAQNDPIQSGIHVPIALLRAMTARATEQCLQISETGLTFRALARAAEPRSETVVRKASRRASRSDS